MEIKQLKIVTKEWVSKNLQLFEQKFLSKKYATITELNKTINHISETIDNGEYIDGIINKKGFTTVNFVKTITDINPNEANPGQLYVVLDKDVIDEENKYHVFVVDPKDVNDTKAWAEISSPSIISECSNIDFETEFKKYEILYKNPVSFANWITMRDWIQKSCQYTYQTGYGANGANGYRADLRYNGSLGTVAVYWITDNGKDGSIYINRSLQAEETSGRDALAQKIINPESLENGN